MSGQFVSQRFVSGQFVSRRFVSGQFVSRQFVVASWLLLFNFAAEPFFIEMKKLDEENCFRLFDGPRHDFWVFADNSTFHNHVAFIINYKIPVLKSGDNLIFCQVAKQGIFYSVVLPCGQFQTWNQLSKELVDLHLLPVGLNLKLENSFLKSGHNSVFCHVVKLLCYEP